MLSRVVAGMLLASLITPTPAFAGKTFSFGEDKSVSIDLGIRASFTDAENATPNGITHSSDFNFDSVRFGSSVSLNQYIKGRLSVQKDPNDKVRVLDAYLQLEFLDQFNIRAGHVLPLSDRANLDGAYYLNTWAYPGMVSQYPARFLGYDNGGLVWGKLFDKRVFGAAHAIRWLASRCADACRI